MVDIERVVTLDELMEYVPEDLVRDAETRRQELELESQTYESKSNMTKDLSKAQRIRNYLEENPDARNKDVVEALEEYKVTAADVANVKSIAKKSEKVPGRKLKDSNTKPKSERTESTSVASPGASISLPELEAGVAFVKAAGSIMRAKHLLIIIEQIKAC